jgi:hypothetical protein
MIVIGVDVHKHSLTAVAVDQVGRAVAELTVGSSGELVAWSTSLAAERLWATASASDRVRLAARTPGPPLGRHQLRRHPQQRLARSKQPPLQRPRQLPAVLDRQSCLARTAARSSAAR